MTFLTPKLVKIDPSKASKKQIFDRTFRFMGSFINLWLKNTAKCRPYKAKTIPKYFPKKLHKSSVNDFFEPQNDQNTGVNSAKSVDFKFNFRSTSSKISLLVPTVFKKSFPLIAEDM